MWRSFRLRGLEGNLKAVDAFLPEGRWSIEKRDNRITALFDKGMEETPEKALLILQKKRRKDRQQATTKRRRQGDALPNSFAALLGQFFKGDPEALAQIEQSKAIDAWPRYVGEAASRVSKAARIRNGTITIVVTDPMWMQELSFQKKFLLTKYQEEFPKLGIRDMYFSRR